MMLLTVFMQTATRYRMPLARSTCNKQAVQTAGLESPFHTTLTVEHLRPALSQLVPEPQAHVWVGWLQRAQPVREVSSTHRFVSCHA